MMSLDVIEGYVDVPFFQVGVDLQVLEDFRHHFVTEVRITEHFKCRYVRPEEVSIRVIHVIRSLKVSKKTTCFSNVKIIDDSYYGHILVGVKDILHELFVFAKQFCQSHQENWHEILWEEFWSKTCFNSDCRHFGC